MTTLVQYGRHARFRLGTPCEACGGTASRLVADHCHAHGWVRGYVCKGCNSHMKFIDQRATPKAGIHLLDTLLALWHRCPDCGPLDATDLAPANTVSITIRLPIELHERLRLESFETRESMNSLILAAVRVRQRTDSDNERN